MIWDQLALVPARQMYYVTGPVSFSPSLLIWYVAEKLALVLARYTLLLCLLALAVACLARICGVS